VFVVVERFDVVVVGAGPAGSTTAYRLAAAGARTLLLDRARFPRDKPCGGGLTYRAVRLLPFAVEPVVEHVVDRLVMRLDYGRSFERRARGPLILMTQRRRLDAFLAEQAARAGVDFRDGVKVARVEEDADGVIVTAGGARIRARLVIGADGANGVVARASGLGGGHVVGVAYEGNVPHGAIDPAAYAGRALVEMATVPGGYGWVFPKGDHVNIGVGGWEREGPRLRDHLRRLCSEHGIPEARLEAVRGHRLPMRRPDARLARARVALVGDAAGLVDPVSGDGMYEAFTSAKLAAEAAADVLEGRAATLDPYHAAVQRALGRLAAASWAAKVAFDRYPRTAFAIAGLRLVWPPVDAVMRGELAHPALARGPARAPLKALAALARAAGDPGRAYKAVACDADPQGGAGSAAATLA
jgi:geranylgeranyl reductase family protein